MQEKKDKQYKVLVDFLESKNLYEKNKGYEALIPFLEKYERVLSREERSSLFRYILNRTPVMEEFCYMVVITEEERKAIISNFKKNPIRIFRCSNLSRRVLSTEERLEILTHNKYKLTDYAIIKDFNTFLNFTKEILDTELIDYVVDSIFYRKRRFSDRFLKEFIDSVEKKDISVSQEQYEELLSVYVIDSF